MEGSHGANREIIQHGGERERGLAGHVAEGSDQMGQRLNLVGWLAAWHSPVIGNACFVCQKCRVVPQPRTVEEASGLWRDMKTENMIKLIVSHRFLSLVLLF